MKYLSTEVIITWISIFKCINRGCCSTSKLWSKFLLNWRWIKQSTRRLQMFDSFKLFLLASNWTSHLITYSHLQFFFFFCGG